MASKTFKIGERAVYGIWRVAVSKTKILIQGIDYFSKKVEESKEFDISQMPKKLGYGEKYNGNEISNYLGEKMDSYHEEQILDFIKKSTGAED